MSKRRLIKPSTLFTAGTVSVIIVGINYFFLKQNPLVSDPLIPQTPSIVNEMVRAPGPSRRKVEEAQQVSATDPSRAITLLDQAIDLDSNNVNALGMLAGIYLNQGEKQKARDLAMDCLDVDSKNTECNLVMISSYLRYGEFEAADRYLSDCLVDDPNNLHCLGGKLTVYLNRERLGEAKEMVDQMSKTSPNSVWTHLARAQYFEKTGSIEEARSLYQKACSMGQAFACSQVSALPTVSPTPSP